MDVHMGGGVAGVLALAFRGLGVRSGRSHGW